MNPRFRLVPSSAFVIISLAVNGIPLLAAQNAAAAMTQEAAAAPAVPAPGAPIHRQLSSGLHLIAVERPGSKVTAIEVQVRVGSGTETETSSGLAHLCEHMVFKGTASLQPGAIDAAIEGLGGELNARTGRISTQFSMVVPSANWRQSLDVAGDMLRNAAFRPDDLTAERKVIHAEMAWADCEPVRAGYSDVAGVAFEAADPDRFAIMGPVENLDKFTTEDLTAFYHRWYRPENLTLVVAGDIKADDVATEAAKLFPLPNDRAAPAATPPIASPKMLPGVTRAPAREVGRTEDRALVSVFLGFPIPMSEIKDQLPALDTLTALLAVPDQPQGRLEAALVEKRGIAVSVAAEFVPGTITGLLVLSATGEPQYSRRIEEALLAEVRRLHDVPLAEDEVDDARFTAASNVNGTDAGLAGLAHRLANQDVEGLSHEMSNGYVGVIGKVNADAVNKLINQYLTPAHYSVAVIAPSPVSKAVPAIGAAR